MDSRLRTFLFSSLLMTSAVGVAQTKKPTITAPVKTEKVLWEHATAQGGDTAEVLTVDARILKHLQTGNVDDVDYLGPQNGKDRFHFIDKQRFGAGVAGDPAQNLYIYSIASVASADHTISLDECDSRITVVTSADGSMGIVFQEADGKAFVSGWDDAKETALAIEMRQYGPLLSPRDQGELERVNKKGEKIEKGISQRSREGDGNYLVVQHTLQGLLGVLSPERAKELGLEYLEGIPTAQLRLEKMISHLGKCARSLDAQLVLADITDSVRVNVGDKDGTGIVYANSVQAGHVAFKPGDTPAQIVKSAQEQNAAVTGKRLHALYKADNKRVSDRMQGQVLAMKDAEGVPHIYTTLGCDGSGIKLVLPDEETRDENGTAQLKVATIPWEDIAKKGVYALNLEMMESIYEIENEKPLINPPSFDYQLGGYALSDDAGKELEQGADNTNGGSNFIPTIDLQIGAPPHPWPGEKKKLTP